MNFKEKLVNGLLISSLLSLAISVGFYVYVLHSMNQLPHSPISIPIQKEEQEITSLSFAPEKQIENLSQLYELMYSSKKITFGDYLPFSDEILVQNTHEFYLNSEPKVPISIRFDPKNQEINLEIPNEKWRIRISNLISIRSISEKDVAFEGMIEFFKYDSSFLQNQVTDKDRENTWATTFKIE
jgi:hypothetical protein